MLKDLHIEHVQNIKTKNNDLPNMKYLVRNDYIPRVCYYEHRMNDFWKLLLKHQCFVR
jgi:hypothetical protein